MKGTAEQWKIMLRYVFDVITLYHVVIPQCNIEMASLICLVFFVTSRLRKLRCLWVELNGVSLKMTC
jgi:hypothetical protein